MAKFLIGVLTGIILTGLFLVIAVFAVARMREKPPAVADGSTLVMRLEAKYRSGLRWSSPFLSCNSGRRPRWWTFGPLLRKAAADSRIKAMVLEPRRPGGGLGQARRDARRPRSISENPVSRCIAYLKTPGAREYYLADRRHRIYMAPEDLLNLKGMRVRADVLQKHARQAGRAGGDRARRQVQGLRRHVHAHFDEPGDQEVLNSVIDDLYGNLVAAHRRGPEEDARSRCAPPSTRGRSFPRRRATGGWSTTCSIEDQMYRRTARPGSTPAISRRSRCATTCEIPPHRLGLDGKQRDRPDTW